MARIVNSKFTSIISLFVNTILEDDTIITKVINIDDIVENLRFVNTEKEIDAITGRVSDIDFNCTNVIRPYDSILNLRSYFKEDVVPTAITVDASEQYNSNVVEIPCREILEDIDQTLVKRIRYFLTYAITGEVTLSDETVNTFTVHEGDDLTDIVYLGRGKELTVDGRLEAIKYKGVRKPVQGSTKVKVEIIPTSLVLNSNGKVLEIPVMAIKNIGGAISPVNSGDDINELIVDSETGVVSIMNGKIAVDITYGNDIAIKGAYADVPATVALRNTRTSEENETIMTGKQLISAGSSVEINGCTLKEDALIKIGDNPKFALKNTRVGKLVPTNIKDFAILTSKQEGKTIDMQIVNNYFMASPSVSGNGIYNLFEMNGVLASGSRFSGNYFEEDAASHNDINIYDVEDGAEIFIENNVWEKSSNGIRIGVKGEPKCTIYIRNNTYYATDDDPNYAGLLLVQPYKKLTTSFANMTIIMENNRHNDNHQMFYLYAGSEDMQFDEYNVPTIIVDGITKVAPKPKPEDSDNNG